MVISNFKNNLNIKITNKEKELSTEERRHYLNKLTFVNKRELFIERNILQMSLIGGFSNYDKNNNFIDCETDFSNSNNFFNCKFSNSFVDDYNPNNQYINNYLNSHIINESNFDENNHRNFCLVNNKKNNQKENKINIISNKNMSSEDNSIYNKYDKFDINKKKINEGKSIHESFNYQNQNDELKVNKCNLSSNVNIDEKNSFLQGSKISSGYNNINDNINERNLINIKNNACNVFDNYNFDIRIKNNNNGYNRENRKTVISNVIKKSISSKTKDEKYSNSFASYDCFNEGNNKIKDGKEYLSVKNNNFLLPNSLNEENSFSTYNNSNNYFNFSGTKNSLFLDLKNQDFFFDNQSSNNLANNTYSDVISTFDTRVFDLSKPKNIYKTPKKYIKLNEIENKLTDVISKSYIAYEMNLKYKDENILSGVSNETFSEKELNFININIPNEKFYKNSITSENEIIQKIIQSSNIKDEIELKSVNDKNFNNTFQNNINLNEFYYEKKTNLFKPDNIKETSNNIEKGKSSSNNRIEFINKKISSKNKSPTKIEMKDYKCSFVINQNKYDDITRHRRTIYNSDNNLINIEAYSSYISSIADTTYVSNINNNNNSFNIFNNSNIEFQLNYIRTKDSDDFRKNYIAKLIYKQVWQPSKKEKKHNSLIIFDWDDTLLCTSFLCPNGIYPKNSKLSDMDFENLAKLEFAVLRLLTLSVEKGDVYIITNAAPGWIEYSAEIYYPSLKQILKKIKIISARGEYENDHPGDSRMWKIQAFLNIQKNLDSNLITNIICLGDSLIEMEAGQILASKFSNVFIKSLKFRENPKPEDLNKQLTLVADKFLSIFSAIKNLTIRVERKLNK